MGTFISTLFTYLLPRSGGASTVAELSPIFANNGIDANFPGIFGLSPFYIALLGIGPADHQLCKAGETRRSSGGGLEPIILIITIDSNRSAYYLQSTWLSCVLTLACGRSDKMSREMRIEHIMLAYCFQRFFCSSY